MHGCGICEELRMATVTIGDPRYQNLVLNRQNILYESEDFVVLPSLGPLNDSHVMIVPKKHVNSFSVLAESQLDQVKNIAAVLSDHIAAKTGKELVFFESGAGDLCSHSGGCIVHAHIHCVYESEEFQNRLFEEVDFQEGGEGWYKNADSERGYVWYRKADGEAFICNDPQLPSQFLRYLYSIAVGDARFWNWRRHNNYEGVLRVVDNYGGISKV
jgi:ATP adenylyltransferase